MNFPKYVENYAEENDKGAVTRISASLEMSFYPTESTYLYAMPQVQIFFERGVSLTFPALTLDAAQEKAVELADHLIAERGYTR